MINTQDLWHKTTFLVPLIDRVSEFDRFDAMRSFFNVIVIIIIIIIIIMIMMMMMMMIIIIQASSSWKRNKSKFGPKICQVN